MRRLNAFLLEPGRIEGITFAGLRRSFNNADHPDFAYQWHGRYYSLPQGDLYEHMEGGKTTRQRLIKIDGEPAVEVDISASHLTILHGLLGVPCDGEGDPYGLLGHDRETVKAWLLLALGSSGASHGGNRFLAVKKAGLARYPFLADLPTLGIGPLDLHYHEAEILGLAMEDLMERGIGFLPIHDALMVAERNAGGAVDAIKRGFDRYFRGRLGLTVVPVPIVR
jgi:hypothetical protein